ncbi:hypothetical protein Tco_0910052 [Tanacetum coccineum]|uniref:Uncharacterized protein n=1 Tax=Tanacetum coccineum TaxID=301880 RepID=A0ABQ5CUK5_9ASTR
MGQACAPVLYDADTLFHPTHHPVSIWDSEEVLVHQVVSMKKMNEKPGHVRPANGFYEKLNALMFVPQQELSREQAYWLPANEPFSQTSISDSPGSLPLFIKAGPPRSSSGQPCEDLRSACDREHTSFFELEAEVFKTTSKFGH